MAACVMESSHQSTITGSMHSAQCGNCGTVVATTRKFCGTCGSRLWEPCLKCGAQNSIAERFCSHCGADLQSALEAAVRLIDERLACSIAFEQEGKLLDAAGCLAELPECDHSQLAARIDAVRQRRESLVNQREQAVARRTAIFEEAQRLRDQRRYAAAHALLEQMPASLRDQQIRALLAEVVVALLQIKHLRGKLRETLKSGQLDELVESAEQLMQLEPEAEDVRRLCEQLRQRRDERDAALAIPLLKQARDAIGANDYSRAEARLARIAASAIAKLGGDERKTLEGIGERVWLARLLRTAPMQTKPC